MEALRRIGLLALIISFLTINLCYGQNTAKQNWIKGVEYAAQGKFKEAKGEFEKALKVDPVYGSAKRALKVIEDVIGRKIKSKTAIRLFKGISYYNKEQWDESVAELTKAIEINPRYAYAYIGRGLAYGRKGQHDKAISDYTKAIEINPRYADAYVSRGVTYGKKRQHDQAISDFDKAIELNPRDAMAYYNRGITWEMKGNLDQAIADYTKAVEINPRCSKAYVNRAAIWLNKGDMERAIADFLKRAICFISNEEEFQTTLAALEGRSGRKGESGQSVVPFLGTEGSKGEWTPELLKVAVAGCATAILIPQVQAYKKKAGIADGEMPPEQMRRMIGVLLPVFEEFCGCILDKVSSRYSYAEWGKDPASMKYFNEVIESGECPLPSFTKR